MKKVLLANSDIYCGQEADNYFERNQKHPHSIFIDYLLEIFPRSKLANFDVAEFGIGNGQNLMLLKNYVRKAHGYEASLKACKLFEKQCLAHPMKEFFAVNNVNLAKKFSVPERYDLIVYGFFPYYCDDKELNICLRNTLPMLKQGGYIYLFDFLVRANLVKSDSRNKSLSVYKRSLTFWINHFSAFDLIDMRLFDSSRLALYKTMNSLSTIDADLSVNEEDWLVSALFRLK